MIEAGLISPVDGVLVQECGAGLVRLEVSQDDSGNQQISFELPKPQITPLSESEVNDLEAILGTSIVREFTPCLVDVGARWVVAQLRDAEAVLVNRPALDGMKVKNVEAKATGVIIFGEYLDGHASDVEVRAYAPACGVNEDPVCGSGNGAMAAFIRHTKQTDYFGKHVQASQGAVLGRAGVIYLTISDDSIQVGGNAVTCIDGAISVG